MHRAKSRGDHVKLCRFDDNRLGVVEGDTIRDVSAALDLLPQARYPFPSHDVLIAHLDQVAARAAALQAGAQAIPLDRVTLLSPVANPGKLVAAPVNYEKHLAEVKGDASLHQNSASHTLTIHKAGVFLKATSSLVGPGEGVALRMPERRTDHEVELAFVIGRTASRVPRAEALRYVAGYAIGLDISIRGTEDRSFRKSADSYSVLGPWLVTADEMPAPGNLELELRVNGERRQHSNTRHMTLGVAELIEMASAVYTLHPGDVVFTGTPEGVSPIELGDEIMAAIQGIGSMSVRVRSDSAANVAAAPAPASAGA
jgi:2-keto-4-pentenoate hydratase/2-oxohepta-3-ene-1,7-dioic acid hydratase in catechol pathway